MRSGTISSTESAIDVPEVIVSIETAGGVA
jgi:hypothetical protein